MRSLGYVPKGKNRDPAIVEQHVADIGTESLWEQNLSSGGKNNRVRKHASLGGLLRGTLGAILSPRPRFQLSLDLLRFLCGLCNVQPLKKVMPVPRYLV